MTRLWVTLMSALALIACGGQKLVGAGNTTAPLVINTAGDKPAVTTGRGTTGGGTTGTTSSTGQHTSTGASSTGGGTTGGSSSTTTGTTAGTTTGTTTGACPNTGPQLAGNWTMTSQYNLQQAGLPPINQAFTDVSTALTALSTSGYITIPTWLLQTFTVLASFDVVYNQINVISALTLTDNTAPGDYTATENWLQATSTDSNGNVINVTPSAATGFTNPSPYDVSVCMPTATFASHDIGGALGGLITPLLDGIVSINTMGNYNTLAALLNYVFTGICSSTQGNFAAYAACTGYLTSSLQSTINSDIQAIQISLGVATVQGTGKVESGVLIDMGVWAGTDGAGTFDGTFSCTNP